MDVWRQSRSPHGAAVQRDLLRSRHARHLVFATCPDILTVLRFLAGLGLGGAMPNAAVLASEYVPRRPARFRSHGDNRLRSTRRHSSLRLQPQESSLHMAGKRSGSLAAFCRLSSASSFSRFFRSLPSIWQAIANAGRNCGDCWRRWVTTFPPTPSSFRTPDPREAFKRKDPTSICLQAIGCATPSVYGLHFFFCLMGNYIAIQWLPTMLTES